MKMTASHAAQAGVGLEVRCECSAQYGGQDTNRHEDVENT